MRHFIFLYYIISFSSGLISLILIIFLFLKKREKIIFDFFIFLSAFSLFIFIITLHFYQFTIVRINTGSTVLFFSISFYITTGLFNFSQANFFFNLAGKSKKLHINIITVIYTALPFIITAFQYSFLRNYRSIFTYEYGRIILNLTSILFMIFILVYLIINLKHIGSTSLRTTADFFIISLAVFIPLWILEFILSDRVRIFHPLTLQNLYYLIMNVSVIIYTGRILFARQNDMKVAELTPQFMENYAITPREKQVLILLMKGYSNKYIAAELNISITTARNHIHNIFMKTGVQNRVGLINLIIYEKK